MAVGPAGHVYANDIDPRAIDTLNRLTREHDLGNVSVNQGRQNDPMLPPGRVQAAFLLKVYHQLEGIATREDGAAVPSRLVTRRRGGGAPPR